MDLNDIHFHDSVIKAVVENTANDELRFDVDYPVDWNKNKFSDAFIVFFDVQGYEIHEMPFEGRPTILDVEVVSEGIGRNEIRVKTNAGYRSFSYSSVSIEWPRKYKDVIEEMFYSQKRDDIVKYILNDSVKINSGEFAGSTGSVISIISDRPKMEYLVELGNGYGDVCMSESLLTLVESNENET